MDVVDSHLKELQRTSSEAVTDMRLLIFELRPPVLDEEGLVEAIRTRLELVEGVLRNSNKLSGGWRTAAFQNH